MNRKELKEVIEKHRKWFNNEEGGECANLSGANLSRAELSGANLSGSNLRVANISRAELSGSNLSLADLRGADLRVANLSGVDLSRAELSGANLSLADLRGANLRVANLSGANLSGAFLRGANLSGANLSGANLSGAKLSGVDLSGADLRGADLSVANLSGSNLSGANLSGTNLSKISYNENTAFYAMVCPEKGSFIGFKKAGGKIVELLITDNAKRSSSTTRKCRCSEAVVMSITEIDGNPCEYASVKSDKDNGFVYEVGKTVSVDNFDENRWNECSTGIHFFITRDEAVRY